jgi:2-haloacid dehalogenase
MTTTPPKAIIFDLLTALLDSWTAWDNAAATAIGTHDSDTPDATITLSPSPTSGHTWRQHYLTLTYAAGPYTPYASLVHAAAQRAGLPNPVAAADALLASWPDALQPWLETPAVLRRLRAHGYRIGVVTNCSEELGKGAVGVCARAVEGEGFEFDAVVTAEEAGFYKPRPEPYEMVLKKLGVRAEEAVFVAGSSADVPGASAVGMRVVWHNRVGLAAKEGSRPEREGKTLEEALQDYL